MQNRVLKIIALVAVLLSLLGCSQTPDNSARNKEINAVQSLTTLDTSTGAGFNSIPIESLEGERVLSATDFSKISGSWIEQTSTQLVRTNSDSVEIDAKNNTQSLVLKSTSTGKGYSIRYAMYGLGGVYNPGVSKPVGVTLKLNSLTTPIADTGYYIGIADYNAVNLPGKKYAPWYWISSATESENTIKFENLFSDKEKLVPINPVSPNGSIYIVVLATSNVTVKVQRLLWTFSELDGRYVDGANQGPYIVTSIEKSPVNLTGSRIYYPYPDKSDPYFDQFNGIYRPAGQSPVVVLIPQRETYLTNFDAYYKDLIHRLNTWGFIVVFPKYIDSELAPKSFEDIFKYIDTCFAFMSAENSKTTSPFFGRVLTTRRLVLGVGFGGGAALSYAASTSDNNVMGAVAIAPIDSNISGDKKFLDNLIGPKLNKPVFIISGELDKIAKHADVEALFNKAGTESNSKKTWFEIKGANHQQFFSTITPLIGDEKKPTISKSNQLRIMNRYAVASLQTILGVNYQLPLLPDISPKLYGPIAEIWTSGDSGANDTAIIRIIKP